MQLTHELFSTPNDVILPIESVDGPQPQVPIERLRPSTVTHIGNLCITDEESAILLDQGRTACAWTLDEGAPSPDHEHLLETFYKATRANYMHLQNSRDVHEEEPRGVFVYDQLGMFGGNHDWVRHPVSKASGEEALQYMLCLGQKTVEFAVGLFPEDEYFMESDQLTKTTYRIFKAPSKGIVRFNQHTFMRKPNIIEHPPYLMLRTSFSLPV